MVDAFQLPSLELAPVQRCSNDSCKRARARFPISGIPEKANAASPLPPGLVVRRARSASFAQRQAWTQTPEPCVPQALAPFCKPLGPRPKPGGPRLAKFMTQLSQGEPLSPPTSSTPSVLSSREDSLSSWGSSGVTLDFDHRSAGSGSGSRSQRADAQDLLAPKSEERLSMLASPHLETSTSSRVLLRSSDLCGKLHRKSVVGDAFESDSFDFDWRKTPMQQQRRPRPAPLVMPPLRSCLRSDGSPRSAPVDMRHVSWDSPVGIVVVCTPCSSKGTPMHDQSTPFHPRSQSVPQDDFVSEVDVLRGALLGTGCELDFDNDEVQQRDENGSADDSDNSFNEHLEEVEEAVEYDGDDAFGEKYKGWSPQKSDGLDTHLLSLSATWRRPRQRVRIAIS